MSDLEQTHKDTFLAIINLCDHNHNDFCIFIADVSINPYIYQSAYPSILALLRTVPLSRVPQRSLLFDLGKHTVFGGSASC